MPRTSPSHAARWVIAVLFVLTISTAPVRAQSSTSRPLRAGDPVIVQMTAGEAFYGEFVSQDAETLVVRIAGVNTTIQTQYVERVTLQRTPTERYHSMRAIIDDTDVPRLMLLIDWLMEQNLLDEARAELDDVLDIEPTNPEARSVGRVLDQRIVLRDRSEQARPERADPADAPPRPVATPPGRFEPGEFPLLTDTQVNLMKVYELDLRDPPRLLIERSTVERFLNEYAGAAGLPRTEVDRRDFFRKPPAEILDLMFRLRARELYPEVRVLDLPDSLKQFRDAAAGAWLTRNCGSTSCHGGADAPPPHLFNKRPFSETSVLTNFLIIDRFRLPDGAPLIDYERPGDSPILQLGLPRPISARPHPDVPGWRPAFRTRDVARYGQSVDWINAMIRPRPDVPIDYDPLVLTAPPDPPASESPPTPQER